MYQNTKSIYGISEGNSKKIDFTLESQNEKSSKIFLFLENTFISFEEFNQVQATSHLD